jgi:hypothetical protein
MKYLETSEWWSLSPHVSTQATKEGGSGEALQSPVAVAEAELLAACVSPDTSEVEATLPIRRQVSTGSMSTGSDPHNIGGTGHRNESDDILEGISFRALSLNMQQDVLPEEESSPPNAMAPAGEVTLTTAKTTKRRIVKAIRITSIAQESRQQPAVDVERSPLKCNEEGSHVSLEARKTPFHSKGGANFQTLSDSSIGSNIATACIDGIICPPPVPSFSADSSPMSKLKRSRGGSDYGTANQSQQVSATLDRRKRRRMNRNRAMTASEFNSILSQINNTGSM